MYEEIQERYFTIKINPNNAGITLLDLFKKFYLSKQKINYLLDNNCCFINGDIVTKDTILNRDDYLMIDISNFERIDYIEENKKIEVLYEDDYLLIVNKPAGYIIYPDSKEKTNTMANIIAGYYLQTGQNNTIRHCHRLDTDTSGCLVYAKDIFTHSYLCKLFEEHKIDKTYLTIVEGCAKKDAVIRTSIGKDRHHSGKMIVTNNGQPAFTKYKLLKTNNRLSFVKVNIKTGRTHQIRVHLSHNELPIYGDTMYGAKHNGRIMLHCYSLKFNHPITGFPLTIVGKMPSDMEKIIKKELLTCDLRRILL